MHICITTYLCVIVLLIGDIAGTVNDGSVSEENIKQVGVYVCIHMYVCTYVYA